jgi:2'-5' RNA ligase
MSRHRRCVGSSKTFSTAAVLIPPDERWPPIQAVRRRHDRHLHRWMSHITLLYPFRPRAEFEALAPRLARACADIAPFRVELAEIRCFRHRRGDCTLWLAPGPSAPWRRLQAALAGVAPDCDDVARHRGGFTPHLSFGQTSDEAAMRALRDTLQAAWRPLAFTAQQIGLIWRGEPPDDVFRVGRTVALGIA